MDWKGSAQSYHHAQILKTGNMEIKHFQRKIESGFLVFSIIVYFLLN